MGACERARVRGCPVRLTGADRIFQRDFRFESLHLVREEGIGMIAMPNVARYAKSGAVDGSRLWEIPLV